MHKHFRTLFRPNVRNKSKNNVNVRKLATNYSWIRINTFTVCSWSLTNQQLTYLLYHWRWLTNRSCSTTMRGFHSSVRTTPIYSVRPLSKNNSMKYFMEQKSPLAHKVILKGAFDKNVRLARSANAKGSAWRYLPNKGCWALTVNSSGIKLRFSCRLPSRLDHSQTGYLPYLEL